MALPKKEVRAWFDFDVHAAIKAFGAAEDIGPAEWVQNAIQRIVLEEIHRYKIRKAHFDALVLVRKDTENTGNSGQ